MNDLQGALLVIAPYFFYLLGGIARIFVPYFVSKAQEQGPLKFDWSYLRGQLAGWILVLILMIVTSAGQLLTDIGSMSYVLAFGAGWFAGDIGREGQKAVGLRGGG